MSGFIEFQPLFGMRVRIVDPGTIVTDGTTGMTLIVSETEAVVEGSTIWCTQKHADLLRAKSKQAQP